MHRSALAIALPPALAAVLLAAATLVAPPARAATYRGRSVDGRRFTGSIMNPDAGKIDGVEIRFRDEHAYVSLRGLGRIVLILQDEEITDPRRIAAEDPRRGIVWEMDVRDLATGAK